MYNDEDDELELRPECDSCPYFSEGICQKGVCMFRDSREINLYDEEEDYEHKGFEVITKFYNKENIELKP